MSKKINIAVRFRNPSFIISLVLAVITPVMAYMGITAQDITTWGKLGSVLLTAISNPYVLFTVAVSVYNAVIDPTTKGISDSERALGYDKPGE